MHMHTRASHTDRWTHMPRPHGGGMHMRLTNASLMMQNAIFENSKSFVFDFVHCPKSLRTSLHSGTRVYKLLNVI